MKKLNITTQMADGRELHSVTSMADYLLWEKTSKKQAGWSTSIADNPTTWEAFLAWASLRRTGQIDSSFERFIGGEVDIVDANVIEADPTPVEVITD